MFMFVGGWAIIALNFGFYVSRMFVAIFECTPREKIWNKLYVGGSCVDNDKLHIATGFFNIFTDLVILLLPLRSLWQLRIPLRKKFGVSLLFTTGLLYVCLSPGIASSTWTKTNSATRILVRLLEQLCELTTGFELKTPVTGPTKRHGTDYGHSQNCPLGSL
jgi:hypothetical protein